MQPSNDSIKNFDNFITVKITNKHQANEDYDTINRSLHNSNNKLNGYSKYTSRLQKEAIKVPSIDLNFRSSKCIKPKSSSISHKSIHHSLDKRSSIQNHPVSTNLFSKKRFSQEIDQANESMFDCEVPKSKINFKRKEADSKPLNFEVDNVHMEKKPSTQHKKRHGKRLLEIDENNAYSECSEFENFLINFGVLMKEK